MSNEIEHGMEILPIPDCERLLGSGGVGILALPGVDAPILRPVNFALSAGWLIIRTGEGQILEAAQVGSPTSFVLSQVDRLEHTGWSVVVTGKLMDRSGIEGMADIPLRPWARAEKHRFVGLSIEQISGRRIAIDQNVE
jgi:nitroimidazol reductase NimA-like FMN-containing flavoprotein (pyridoxamine 5'-phosphate oxidase superfamily)